MHLPTSALISVLPFVALSYAQLPNPNAATAQGAAGSIAAQQTGLQAPAEPNAPQQQNPQLATEQFAEQQLQSQQAQEQVALRQQFAGAGAGGGGISPQAAVNPYGQWAPQPFQPGPFNPAAMNFPQQYPVGPYGAFPQLTRMPQQSPMLGQPQIPGQPQTSAQPPMAGLSQALAQAGQAGQTAQAAQPAPVKPSSPPGPPKPGAPPAGKPKDTKAQHPKLVRRSADPNRKSMSHSGGPHTTGKFKNKFSRLFGRRKSKFGRHHWSKKHRKHSSKRSRHHHKTHEKIKHTKQASPEIQATENNRVNQEAKVQQNPELPKQELPKQELPKQEQETSGKGEQAQTSVTKRDVEDINTSYVLEKKDACPDPENQNSMSACRMRRVMLMPKKRNVDERFLRKRNADILEEELSTLEKRFVSVSPNCRDSAHPNVCTAKEWALHKAHSMNIGVPF